MTRINLIDPSLLCDKHLMAEYRELIRIPNGVISGRLKPQYPDAPKEYTLGAGHIKFFVDKLPWLFARHLKLYEELVYHRYFDITWMEWEDIIPSEHYHCNSTWEPTQTEISINLSRIIDRMPANPKWTNRPTPDYWKGYKSYEH